MLKKLFKKFVKEEEGSVIEYILVIAVVAVILAMVFPNLRNSITEWVRSAMASITDGIGTP